MGSGLGSGPSCVQAQAKSWIQLPPSRLCRCVTGGGPREDVPHHHRWLRVLHRHVQRADGAGAEECVGRIGE